MAFRTLARVRTLALRHRRALLGPSRRSLCTLLDPNRLITLEPHERHDASVVVLHGIGDTALGWLEPCEFWQQQLPTAKFIIPTAPSLPVTINGSFPMPAWFDLTGAPSRAEEPCAGLDESSAAVVSLLRREAESGVAPSRLAIVGFSQGGAVALRAGLQLGAGAVGAVAALSSYLPRPHELPALLEGSPPPPVLYCHGTADSTVPLDAALDSAQRMEEGGVAVEMRRYPGLGHSVSMEELEDVSDWLERRLKN